MAISKVLSDDLILVGFLVRKVGQDPPAVKEAFLNSVDSQSSPPDMGSRQALNSMSYINLIYRSFLHLFMQRSLLQSLDWCGLELEFHSMFPICLCQFASVALFPGIKYVERIRTDTTQSLGCRRKHQQLMQMTRSFLWAKPPSNIEVWLWVPHTAVRGLQWSLWFLLGSLRLTFLPTFTHGHLTTSMPTWANFPTSFSRSCYFLLYFYLARVPIWVF